MLHCNKKPVMFKTNKLLETFFYLSHSQSHSQKVKRTERMEEAGHYLLTVPSMLLAP